MHTVQSLYAESVTADRIGRAAAHRAAREASAPRRRLTLHLHFRRARRAAVPSV